jgi:hypothetical protein
VVGGAAWSLFQCNENLRMRGETCMGVFARRISDLFNEDSAFILNDPELQIDISMTRMY